MPPQKRWHVRTSSFLSSQVVSNQVLSTYECLTTVFEMGTGGTTQLSPLDFVKVCSGQRQPIALRFQLALLGRFRIRAVSESTAPLRVCLFDSSAAVNVCQSCGALRACILGTFPHTTCYPIGFASWTGQHALKTIQKTRTF